MKRREFLALIGTAAVVRPLGVHAQQPEWMRRIMRRREFIALVSGAAAWPLLAFAAFNSATAAEPPCACRALGRSFELGQSACLSTPKGPRIAICVMVLNMTSWQVSDTPCVGARLIPGGGGQSPGSARSATRAAHVVCNRESG